MKDLWRRLLPGTPFPACGVAEETVEEAAPAKRDAEPSEAAPAPATDADRAEGQVE